MAALIETLAARRKKAAAGATDAQRALSELRSLGAKLRAERAALLDRPIPLEQAQSAAETSVISEAARIVGDVSLAGLTRPADGRTPSLTLTLEQQARLAFAAAAEGVAALLGAALADHYRDLGLEGIDNADRTAELARLDADALAVELAEEGIIREMEAGGAAPLRRPDADARALLAADAEFR